MLFNKQVEESRINEVSSKIYGLWNGWRPYQSNAFDLYKETGSDWTKIDLSKLTTKDWNDSWVGMPKAALDYIVSLQEFDASLFKEITGLESTNKETIKIGDQTYDKQEVEQALKNVKAIK